LNINFKLENKDNTHNEISKYPGKIVVDAAFQIHFRLGPGLLESVYETLMIYELKKRNIPVENQKAMPVYYDGKVFDEGLRADLVVDKIVIVELKSVEKTLPVHQKQLLTYLKASNLQLGLLINFGEVKIKEGISRIVNGL
jgi:GxxExxY protein